MKPEEKDAERVDLLQLSLRNYIEESWGKEGWIVLSDSNTDGIGVPNYYSALAPDDSLPDLFETCNWDLQKIGVIPTTYDYYDDDGNLEETEYLRFGNDKGLEPLMFVRSFPGIKPPNFDLSEEFRLFHNLYHDSENNCFFKIDEEQNRTLVTKIEGYTAKVRKLELLQFLAKRKINLVLYIECFKESRFSLEEHGMEKQRLEKKEENFYYRFFVDNWSGSGRSRALSGILGKMVIRYPAINSVFPQCEEQYEEFIIGINEFGVEVKHSCEHRVLDKNDHLGRAPGWLTPVHFRKEVLRKYYAEPDKYEIGPHLIRCLTAWSLQVDIEHRDRVICYLGYLGRDLPLLEQKHWRGYNIFPEGGLSRIAMAVSFYGVWEESEMPDFRFKSLYERVNDIWISQFGWPLFKILREDDKYKFQSLRIPLSENQAEFEDQVKNLAIILVDSLNEADIEQEVGKDEGGLRGIGKLECLFKTWMILGFETHILFLKKLMDIRAGVAHRKGDKYERGKRFFKLDEIGYVDGFAQMIFKAVNFLEFVNDLALKMESESNGNG